MSNVINRTTKQYIQFVNTPDYPDTDWIINPDLSAVDGIPQKYWKIVADTVVLMSSEEQTAVDASISASFPMPGKENYREDIYDSKGNLLTTTWYVTKLSEGSYSNKIRSITYTYSGTTLMSDVDVRFASDGTTPYTTVSHTYLVDLSDPSNQQLMESHKSIGKS